MADWNAQTKGREWPWQYHALDERSEQIIWGQIKKNNKNVEWIKKQSSADPNHPVSHVALVLSDN